MTTPITLNVVLAIWGVLVLLGLFEAWRHRAIIRTIPVRVHVNGTRGKTSVTRLIAAGLRGGGKRVCAKTTGSAAALTDPDGNEFPIYRISGANIIEQMRMLKRMAAYKPEIVVIECMALQPAYQSLCELKMVQSTVGVITNARPDHLDVMGPGEEDVARALAGSTPVKGTLFTAEQDLIDILDHAAKDRGSRTHQVALQSVEALDDDLMRQFQYSEHAENVALALDICEHLGVEREAALQGMINLAPETGAMQVLHVNYFERDIVFVNAFAANDPESTGRIWENMVSKHGDKRRKILLVNCRADRPQRSQQMAEAAATWTLADRYIVMGSGTQIFVREALKAGLSPQSMLLLEGADMVEITETLLETGGKSSLVIGVCNIHGGGEQVARFFHNRSVREEDL